MTMLWTSVLAFLLTIGLAAQEAAQTLPSAYRVQFENEWVKVTNVRYEPWAKLPAHAHTPLPSAYVYLNDGGPVAFKHIGAAYGAATRPPTKTGSFRLYRGLEEVHEVENLSAAPSEFLRVEFKTDPVDARTLKGKFPSEPAGNIVVEKAQFENAQLRVTRFIVPAGNAADLQSSTFPSLIVVLSQHTRGSVRWLSAGQMERLNADNNSEELLRFELKTRPLSGTAEVR